MSVNQRRTNSIPSFSIRARTCLRESSLDVALFRVSTCAMNSSLEMQKAPGADNAPEAPLPRLTVAVYTVTPCAFWSPVGPASSARTSSSGCWPPARTWSCWTSSPTRATRPTCPRTSSASGATSPSREDVEQIGAGRCHRQLRRRDTRRPLDPRPGGVRAHRRPGDARAAPGRGGVERPASCRCRPTRSTATSSRAGRRARTIRCSPRARTARRRPAATCRCSPQSGRSGSTRRSRAARTPTGPTSTRRRCCRCSSTNALDGEPLPLYGDGRQVRDWLHVEDHCAAIELVLRQGEAGEVYNVGANEEHENVELTRLIVDHLGADPRSSVTSRIARDTTGATRSTRRRSAPSAGSRGVTGTTACARRSTGTATTASGGSRSSARTDFREYYDRQYAARLG